MDDAVRTLAREAGILVDWTDAASRPQRVSVGSLRRILDALGYPSSTKSEIAESRGRLRQLARGSRTFYTATSGEPVVIGGVTRPPIREPGYHVLDRGKREITVAVAPPRCVTFNDVAPDARMYGLAIQLYALRQDSDAGFGDARALADFVKSAARNGADAVALSPTHSLFASDHAHYAPYSPSSRLFLNPLYADPTIVFGQARVARAAQADSPDGLIDWPRTARQKYSSFRELYEDFASKELRREGDALAADFRSFEHDGGARLREHAVFEALHARWFAEQKRDWRHWPDGWQGAVRTEADGFIARDEAAVQFHVFLQWLADRSFAHAQRTARESGMRIGLISDLAVGLSPSGSHAWSRQKDLLLGVNIGAPPDLHNTRGQDWGLTGFSPQALIASGYEPFIATLRAAMRHAGGVRIDHAMGLARLWLVPQGASPAEGAYLTYPLDEMLRLIALESHLHRAVVIGEDLGTVEPGFREKIAAAGIAGMDVLWFQRDGDDFMPPSEWRRDAVAMTSTHDLPTVAGWWSGADIDTRNALGLTDVARETKERGRDRVRLWEAFREADVVDVDTPTQDAAVAVDAAVALTAKSPAALALIPIEDVLGVAEQPNLPGTIDEHPNWRRRLTQPADQLLEAPRIRTLLDVLRQR